MANEKNIQTRIQNKHDLEINWLKAENFVPLQGELIVYDAEVDADGNTLTKVVDGTIVSLLPEDRDEPFHHARIKIGDGVQTVNNLPFIFDEEVDTTLTQEGLAADAKAVGDALALKVNKTDLIQSDWAQTDETAVDFIKNKPETLVECPVEEIKALFGV